MFSSSQSPYLVTIKGTVSTDIGFHVRFDKKNKNVISTLWRTNYDNVDFPDSGECSQRRGSDSHCKFFEDTVFMKSCQHQQLSESLEYDY